MLLWFPGKVKMVKCSNQHLRCEQFRLYNKTWVRQLASGAGDKKNTNNPETADMLLQQNKEQDEWIDKYVNTPTYDKAMSFIWHI